MTMHRTESETRRIGLNSRQRCKDGPGRQAGVLRQKDKMQRVSGATELVGQIFKNARDMVNMGRNPTVLLEVQKATQNVTKAFGSI